MGVKTKKRTQHLTLEADTRELSKARDALRNFLAPLNFDDLDKDSLMLAFDEAVTNAITYGPNVQNGFKPCGPNQIAGEKVFIEVAFSSDAEGVSLSVTDQGPGYQGEIPECGPLATSGRGIMLMNSLVDEVTYERGADCGTTVTLRKFFSDELS